MGYLILGGHFRYPKCRVLGNLGVISDCIFKNLNYKIPELFKLKFQIPSNG
jgi:hypothetical protein